MNWLNKRKWRTPAVLVGLSLLAAACYPAASAPTPPGETTPPVSAALAAQTAQPPISTPLSPAPTPLSPAPTPRSPAPTPGGPAPTPGPDLVRRLTDGCDLLDSHDLATLLTTAEVQRGPHTAGQVDPLIFGGPGISATESSCLFYAYHKPSSATGELLQVQYWVDIPGQVTPAAWSEAWTSARPPAAQAVTGIGDDAFYDHGRLIFKKGSLYFTLQALDNRPSAGSSADQKRLMQIEEQLAKDMLSRLR